MSRRFYPLLALALLGLGSPAAKAAVPATLTHEGRLTTPGGDVIEGNVEMTFTLYDAAEDGDVIWSETHDVEVRGGYFAVSLGADVPFASAFAGAGNRWLGVTVGGDDEMRPRSPIGSVPYALMAQDVVGDIHPQSITVNGVPIVDAQGRWIGPTAGLEGPAGPAGAAGKDGVGVTLSVEPAGDHCAAGGVRVDSADGTTWVCHGVMGAAGPQGSAGISVTATSLAPGDECAFGGVRVDSERGPVFLCNGTPGAPGVAGVP
ncbi:MAG: hypothetical protein KC635_04295, partial [Myxococcales bacterium]|nr:hypothetical protein [Myxococcales bacterium]